MNAVMMVVGALATMATFAAHSARAGDQPADREGLLLEWRFNGDLRDSSGNGHAGTPTGSCTFVPGREGRCLALDGQRSFVSADTSFPSLNDSFTVECWVKPAAAQSQYACILGNHAGNFTGFAIQQEGAQTNRYYFTYGTGSVWIYSRTFQLVADQWQHVAVTKSSTDLRVVLNGLLVDTTPVRSAMVPSDTPFMAGLGIAGQPRWFTGQLADLRVWGRVVNPSVSVPLEVQREQFVRTARLTVEASSRWRLFKLGGENRITFSLDAASVPEGIGSVSVTFACQDQAGAAAEFPA